LKELFVGFRIFFFCSLFGWKKYFPQIAILGMGFSLSLFEKFDFGLFVNPSVMMQAIR